ncbi:hypothetical protein [Ornithinimicrobium sp. INDO-MA30-4]|uniref:hypothetical protein n=1 Tax=Ornithinimicrobium sp. INDO-MA30-4 TaxID=2908651 RepID=UPI001F1C7A0E|nr:hypothetical protein [Ornithinimicrobium sp. INDO-MA30-4]UJH71765.1 hypothetical protein L0A91_16915 [Ornithinimicrobium sp. INDO-MA30-4]
MAGLTGAGIVLGAGAFLALAARRRGQFRHRNPGRAIATPDPVLDPVVKTLETVGNSAVASVQGLDDTLRRLGATYRDAQELLPVLAAVELAKSGLTLHLSEPSELLGSRGYAPMTTCIGASPPAHH